MTGFSRAQGRLDALSWVWELRSVNGKGMDTRLRLPPGYESLETGVRKLIGSAFVRGNIQASLQVSGEESGLEARVNQDIFDSIWKQAGDLAASHGGTKPSVSEVLLMRGVVELDNPAMTTKAAAARDKAMMESLQVAVDDLLKMRCAEGVELVSLLRERLDGIETLHQEITKNPAREPSAIREHLKQQVAKLLDASDQLDEERLHQEAVILAAKSDIAEELDRLTMHVKSAMEILASEGPAGRKLDFLSQELNRECNTICSKSNAGEVSALGLDMKLLIDQFREQLQNLE